MDSKCLHSDLRYKRLDRGMIIWPAESGRRGIDLAGADGLHARGSLLMPLPFMMIDLRNTVLPRAADGLQNASVVGEEDAAPSLRLTGRQDASSLELNIDPLVGTEDSLPIGLRLNGLRSPAIASAKAARDV